MIVIPRHQRQAAVLFIQTVIVPGVGGIAVVVENERVDGKVAQQLVHIQCGGSVLLLIDDADGFHQPPFVTFTGLENGVVPDCVVIGKRFALILQPHRHVVHAQKLAGIHCAVRRRKLGQAQRGVLLRAGNHARNVHLLGLVQLAVLCAIIAQREGIRQAFHRRIQADDLAVELHLHEAAQGCGYTHRAHHVVAEIIPQEAAVADVVVQRHLVQPVVALALVEFAKVEHQRIAIPFADDALNERGISLRAHAHMIERFAVDGYIAVVIFLIKRAGFQALPRSLRHFDFHGMNKAVVEQPVFIFRRNAGGRSRFLRGGGLNGRSGQKPDGIQNGQHHRGDGKDGLFHVPPYKTP